MVALAGAVMGGWAAALSRDGHPHREGQGHKDSAEQGHGHPVDHTHGHGARARRPAHTVPA